MEEAVSEFESCVIYQVWNKRTGERIEVGADRDGLAMCEIRSISDDGKVSQALVVPDEALEMLHASLGLYIKDRKEGREPTS